MKILAIETSCDETAIAILEGIAIGEGNAARFTVLGNTLMTQIELHREYGGVFPALAKREHAKNLIPILESALSEANMLHESTRSIDSSVHDAITTVLEREPGLTSMLLETIFKMETPNIDAIAVTAGPGLEPALWVGVNFAKALSLAWEKPLVSVNHMEGHICTALATVIEKTDDSQAKQILDISATELPLLSLLISGGHTELVVAREWLSYELVGATRDDAVGEAFDKVARMLGLPYPGGPEISRLAERARARGGENSFILPRPMIHEPHCDFSFSGLKTAVLYLVKGKELDEEQQEDIARAFEDAAADVLYAKTVLALMNTSAKTLALGGGVSANAHIQRVFAERMATDFPDVRLCIPAAALTSDNALMIGLAGFYHAQNNTFTDIDTLRANGNRTLAGNP